MFLAPVRELKLKAPAAFSLARQDIRIEPYRIARPTRRRLHTIYYDTADLRLTRWGASLRFRFGDGWTVKLPQPQGDDASYRTERTFTASPQAVPDDALSFVAGIVRSACVVPVVELRTLRTIRNVSLDEREIAEIVEDDVHVVRSSGPIDRFRQIEIELIGNAPEDSLDTLYHGLRRYGVGKPDRVSKIVLALGDRAAEHEISPPAVDAQSAAGDVARAALGASVKRFIGTDPLLRADMKAGAVHDARVAVRRLRSDLRTFEPLFEAEWSRDLRARLRWLSSVLGAARDRDVLLEEVDDYATSLPEIDRRELTEAVAPLRGHRDQAYRDVLTSISDSAFVELLDALVLAARRPRFNARALEPAAHLTEELYAPVWKKLRKLVLNAGAMPHDLDLHRIRIKAKNARYAAEALTPVCGVTTAKLASCLEALQTALGTQHDAVHACGELRNYAAGSAHAFFLGELTAVACARAVSRREGWHTIWAAARTQRKRFAHWRRPKSRRAAEGSR
jgi:CHAD domain-containing protein